jgi:hypothetical protein
MLGTAKEDFVVTYTMGGYGSFTKGNKYEISLVGGHYVVKDDNGFKGDWEYEDVIRDFEFTIPLKKPEKEEILKRETLENDIRKIKEDIVWARENHNTSVENWLLEMLEIKENKLKTIN